MTDAQRTRLSSLQSNPNHTPEEQAVIDSLQAIKKLEDARKANPSQTPDASQLAEAEKVYQEAEAATKV